MPEPEMPETPESSDGTGPQLSAAQVARRLEQGVELLIATLRWAVAKAGGDLTEQEVEERVALFLAYLRRRMSGEVEVDAYGYDADFTQHIYLPVLRVLYKRWFRCRCAASRTFRRTGRRSSWRTTRAPCRWTA